jgi:pimeloyl-ACP methyl ester carboxylesterase
MVDNWVVFGGWAIPPRILAPLFRPGTLLIDTNEIMPDLVRGDELVKDWQNVLVDRFLPQIPEKPFGIAGWSTGSLLAYALAQRTRPSCGVFISATPSFCRRQGFPHGWKPSILKAMRGGLASDPAQVLTEVYLQCGIETSSAASFNVKNFIAGLFFLEQADLLPVKPLPFPALFLHGKADTVIPSAAGKYFCDAAGGTFIEYEGPHAFFTNQYKDISEFINNYF